MKELIFLLYTTFFFFSCQDIDKDVYNTKNYNFLKNDTKGLVKYYVYKYDTTYKMIEFYWDNDSLQLRSFFKNNKKDGPYVSYGSNGSKWEVSNFKDGKLDGRKINFGENGDTACIEEYQEGVKIK